MLTAPNLRSGVNATLVRGGAISGLVTSAATGLPVSGISVSAYGESGGDSDYTDATGRYTITGLASGAYSVKAAPSFETVNLIGTPQTVTVAAPATLDNVNFALTVGGTLTGQVTGPGGTPLANITVYLGNSDGSYQRYVYTDATGLYTATGMPSGMYRVLFRPRAYIPEAYNNHPDFSAADPIAVAAPGTVTGIDAVLEQGGAISGKLTDATSGAPITSGQVTIYDAAGKRVMYGRLTFLGGWASSSALPSGSYRIEFRDYDDGYIDEFYNDQPSLEMATPVVLSAPTDITGLDAALAQGALISGRVTAADTGAPFSAGSVVVYDASGKQAGYASLDSDGSYRVLTGLASGSYRIGVVPYSAQGEVGLIAGQVDQLEQGEAPLGYSTTYYGRAVTLSRAAAVQLTAPTLTGGVDIAMLRSLWLPLQRR